MIRLDYTKRTWAEIDLDQLEHNYTVIKRLLPNTKMIGTVKADAYGHGEKFIAKKLEQLGMDYFSVSNIDEAKILRGHGILGKILILGYTPFESVSELWQNQITQTIYSTEYAERLNRAAQQQNLVLPVHVKLDTGMHRIGFAYHDQERDLDSIRSLYKLKNLFIQGFFTHLSHADSSDPDAIAFTKRQKEHFDTAIHLLQKEGFHTGLLHVQNSAGIQTMQKCHYDYARPGIILYGMNPSDQVAIAGLRPVLQLKTVVSMVKEVSAGTPIGYSRTFVTKKAAKIATIPIGYADGYSRQLSNKGWALIHGTKAPIVGNVCMDQTMLDVTDIDVQMGDEVTLIGSDGTESITADDLASLIGTINYEITCTISKRVPRVILSGKKPIGILAYH